MIKVVEKVQEAIGIIALTTFFVAIIIQIVTRHLGIAVIWTEELANYTFIWSVFMGASVMVNKKEHFSFNILTLKLQGKAKSALLIVIDGLIFLFAIALLVYGIEAVQNFWNYRWASIPELKMGYVWIAVPIAGATMALYSGSHVISHIKKLGGKGAKA